MAGENLSNLDGILKDTYSKGSTAQTGKGFHKATPKKCAICGSTKNDMRGRVCDKCAFKGK